MINFKKISYKNLLSVGEFPVEINFQSTGTTLITGANGNGKSILGEALIFALYGKPFRKINKNQLVNSINKKGALVELEFDISDDKYVIRRGIKPNIFEIIKNGTLLNQEAAVRDYQSYLEENILKINLRSFTQIVFLGMATYVPFMELPAGSRREIIEDLLDIKVFSKMNTLFKDDLNTNKNDIKDIQSDISLRESLIRQIKSHNEEILKIRNQNTDQISSDIQKNIDLIAEAKLSCQKLEDKMEYFDVAKYNDTKTKFQNLVGLESDIMSNLKTHKKEHQFFTENETCPTCTQEISEEFRIRYESVLKVKIESFLEGLNKIKEVKSRTEKTITELGKIKEHNEAIDNQIRAVRAEISWFERANIDFEKKLVEAKKNSAAFKNDELDAENSRLTSSQKKYDEFIEEKNYYAIVTSVLKDTGFKSHTIKKYVQVINSMINKYLYDFGLYVDFYLDENFNETIKSRYRDDFSYSSFSEGEKMRINLAIMFAWRSLSKTRNSMSSNLLILDETLDGVVDTDGIENLIKTLKTLNKNDNIFVISHRGDQLSDKFDRVINFEKQKNFTIMSEIILHENQ